jgi:hypothetical protein
MMVRTTLLAAGLALAMIASTGFSARAEETHDPAALAKALTQAKVSLQKGLQASAREGKPVSAKYEIEEGALQLSIYTMKNGSLEEVIVDHRSGAIKKAEKITDAGDVKEAEEQREAMAKAKRPLAAAVNQATKANAGYRAVSVTPVLAAGKPLAEVELIKAGELKKVTEKLD